MGNSRARTADKEALYKTRLEQWHSISIKYAHYSAEQSLLENPYIIEKNQDGAWLALLMANAEGQSWYDRLMYTEAYVLNNLNMIRPGDVVFDCGANQGLNALVYARLVGEFGRVHAFDPFPLNGDIIRFNIALNAATNIDYHPFGLSNSSKVLNVSALQQNISAGAQIPTAVDIEAIQLRALDDFAFLMPDFIKMDIEGAELEALEGAQRILKANPAIYIELHAELTTKFNRDYMELFDIVDTSAYICFVSHPQKSLIEYNREFLIDYPAQVFLIPRDRGLINRFFG